MSWLRRRWEGAGGVAEVLSVGMPLVLSHLSYTLQTFVDRLFLTWYSTEAVAGAMTGIFVTYGLIALFTGTGEYVTTFVAQYHGAGRDDRIGPALWQGVWFALLAGAFCAALSPLAGPLFVFVGHPPAVQDAEITFATILLRGSAAPILMATLSSFFAGRGQTRAVLAANAIATTVTIVLDWAWIFGNAGFPRWGVAGAAWATVCSQVVGCLFYALLIGQPHFRRTFHTGRWRLEPELFRRLVRYGLRSGLHLSAEVFAFAGFMLIVGRLGTVALAATSIAFNLNMLVFMPMAGLSLGVSSLVGRYLGANRPEIAERTTWSALSASMVYMTACGSLYLGAPGLLLGPYASGADAHAFPEVAAVATVLLRFVAIYSIFDMMNVIFAAALKGAGDTAFPLRASLFAGMFAMLAPATVLCLLMGYGVYTAWSCAAAYILLVGVLMMWRFHQGGWKGMRVIEPEMPTLAMRRVEPAVGP